MKLIIIVLSCLIFAESLESFQINIDGDWNLFKVKYGKHYKNEAEENYRMKTFFENKDKIEKHNEKYAKGLVSFTLGLNKYADLLYDEFYNYVNGYNSSNENNQYIRKTMPEEGIDYVSPLNFTLPKSINWTERGAVTPVKEQGYCGSCWAFSAVGALEGQNFIHNGVLTSLSVQNLIDCTTDYGNSGCNGGFTRQAYRYVKYNGGIDTEEAYPYKGVDGAVCNFNKSSIAATDRGYVDLPIGDESKMMEAVASVGPLAAVINVNRESLQFYKSGVFDEAECHSSLEYGNHSVLCVGYGTDENGNDYWIIKNSWGDTWGEGGFIKMSRNKNNQCGIANDVNYPLV
ncbi:cathepsin L-like [Eupeodes corollae]|uniref:cathepsin L-like n=1 Tax=Eupeodes corollae TaxID=290404 RepID=UPI0024938DCF|nr:cathepsin L-like [Eupeodes corollae]